MSKYPSHLGARLNNECRRFGLNDNDDFRIVSGILRLSTKYIIDSLRDKTLAHLGVVWPTTLKNWDAREDLARSHELNFLPGDRLYPSPVVRMSCNIPYSP